jgi:hypothetical protein
LQPRQRPATAIGPSREPIACRFPLERVDAGSWNLRFWIGFGTGSVAFAVRTRVIDIRRSAHIFDETVGVDSGTFQFQESILRRCAARLARSIAPKIQAQVHF